MTLEGSRRDQQADLSRLIRRMALVMMVALLPAVPLPAAISDGLFSIGTARGYFREVMRSSLTARPDTERAAFIVVHGDSLSCLIWPPMSLYHQEVFHGELPPGTVAIIHTHPEGSPRPSVADQFEADRLGIPIYVLTRRDVYKAEPGQTVATAVVHRELWLDDRSPAAEIRCSR